MRWAVSLRGVCVVALVLLCAPARAQDTFSTIVGWEDQLFASYILATATMRSDPPEESTDQTAPQALGNPYGVIGVVVKSPASNTPVTVTVECNEIMERTTFHGVMPTRDRLYKIYPRIRYRYGLLTRNKQSTPVAITFTVRMAHNRSEEYTETAILRSVNDCIFATKEDNDKIGDLSFMFAAYVNEQHPFVDQVLREALDEGVVESFSGYGRDDPAYVGRQVFAIWNALSKRDVRYSSITTSAATDHFVYSQHVRLIDESINNRQANCLDGTVLLASLLRKIEIEPVIISLPSHVFLAFYADKERTNLVGLETTAIGHQIDPDDQDISEMKGIVDEKWMKTNAWRTFCQAVASGTARLEEDKDKFNKDDVEYQMISIEKARDDGILPIGFDSSSPFKARPETAKSAADPKPRATKPAQSRSRSAQ